MEFTEELFALRTEQRRLRHSLNDLDKRVDDLDTRWRSSPPEPAKTEPPLPGRAEIAKPAFDIVAAPPPRPLRETAPRTEAATPPSESLELRLGRVWLVRVGIVILLTGLVFLGNYAYHEYIGRLGPVGKLILICLAGGGLCGLGAWLGRKQETLRNYARVLLAGGCATLYYAAYAAHFVPALSVIESPLLGGALLLALGGAFVVLADRLRSQPLAAAAVALTFYVSAINPLATFSLFSNLVIGATAIALLARHRWMSVSILGLVGAYGSYAFWRWQQTQTFLPASAGDIFWPALLFPAAYWLVFTAAVMLRRVSALDAATRPVFLTVNNAAFFALAGPVVAGTHPDYFWLAAVAYGAALVALARIAARRSADEPLFDGAYLAQGIGLILLGLVYKTTGWQEAISFALLGATLVSLGRLRHGAIFRVFAGLSAAVSTVAVCQTFAESSPHARLVAATVAAIFVLSAAILRRLAGNPAHNDWRVFAFTLLAGALCIPACIDGSVQASALRILAVALAATFASRGLGLRETTHSAQMVALFGQGALLLDAAVHGSPPTGALASAGFGLAFVYSWKWQQGFALASRRIWQSLHLAAPVALALWWMAAHLPPEQGAPAAAFLGLAVLTLGWFTSTRILAAASTAFTVFSIAFVTAALGENAPWQGAALTIALLVAQSFLLPRITLRQSPSQLLRAICVLLGMSMVITYVPAAWWFLALVLPAGLFFAAACRRGSNEPLLFACGLFCAAALAWASRLLTGPAQAIDLTGFAVIALAHSLGKGRHAWFVPEVRAMLCSAAVLGLWIDMHRLVTVSSGGFLLTVTWSLLALLVLGSGFALRERTYRVLGLVILAAAVGRIFCIDVWQLETIHRILSFLVLGVVLLALGFFYNRHAEALRRWL